MEYKKCDLCGSDSHTLKFEIDVSANSLRFLRYSNNVPQKDKMTGKQTIVKCDNCDLIYTNPRFDADELNIVYSSNKVLGGNWRNFPYLFKPEMADELQVEEQASKHSPASYKWRFDIIEKYCSDTNLRLMDIGCGNGAFVSDALANGYNAFGIDLSPDRIEQGKQLYGLSDEHLRCMNVDDFDGSEKYDVIVMWDVIEHVGSPSELLDSLSKIMHKDTVLFALTMSIDSITYKLYKKHWTYVNPTQHLHYFSHKTLEAMYNKNDLDLIGVEQDNSKDKNIIHLGGRIVLGFINQFFFRIYAKEKFARKLFKPFQKGISNERMKKRLENLQPGKYVGRYHDNFVFVGKKKA